MLSLKSKYANYIKEKTNNKDYKAYLDDLYADYKLRPYACILLYFFHEEKCKEPNSTCLELVEEMKEYLDNNEVVKFLFKYYGQNLHISENRNLLFKLSKKHPVLEDSNPLRFYYFNFMAESYNHNFHFGRESLKEINLKYHSLNPEFHYLWLDENGNKQIFKGKVIKQDYNKYKAIKVSSLQQTFRLVKGDYSGFSLGQDVEIKLHFYLYGIRAEISK
ncbi:MAG: hypothetical protein HC892_21545 [Saprospiraceae bacterium]|nr:hypothetical protein [Saprospiraceae bacterium]